LQGKADANGWVAFDVLITFKRLSNITPDVAAIVAAAKSSDQLSVSEDDKSVKRSNPLPVDDDSAARTIHINGLKEENKETIESVSELFEKFGKVLAVRFFRPNRSNGVTVYNPCAFVEFETEEEAQKLIEMKEIDYSDSKLQIKSKKEFGDGRKPAVKRKSEKKNEPKPKFELGSILILDGSNFGNKDEMRAHFSKYGRVLFYDGSSESESIVRFAQKSSVDSILSLIENSDGKLEVMGKTVAVKRMDEESEKQYRANNITASFKKAKRY